MQAHIIFNTICILRFFYSHHRHQTYECQQYRDAKNTGYFTEMTQPSKKEDDAELPKATAEMVGPVTVVHVFSASKQPTLPSALRYLICGY